MKSKRKKHRQENKARTAHVQELRRSGAAGSHDKKPVKAVENREAIRDSTE